MKKKKETIINKERRNNDTSNIFRNMFCSYVSRTDHSFTYSYMDRFKYYDLIRHKIYATTTKQ